MYTEAEKNASDATQYASGRALGVNEGNASGIAYVQANPSIYNLYTEAEKSVAELVARGVGEAKTLSEVQANLAKEGLSLLTYLEMVNFNLPHTQNWFYQPGMGWLWTEANTFPFIYRAPDGEEQAGGWLYFSQLDDQPSPSFYDYATKTWITPSSTD